MGEVRLIDVATAAGVSLRTASRVLNGDHRVAGATRERVQDVMRTLEFVPDAMARSLRAGTDTAIGLVVESIADPFFAEMIDAVEAAMAGEGRPVLVASTRRDGAQEQEVAQGLIQRRVAGLLVVSAGESSWRSDAPVPVVFADRAPLPEDGASPSDVSVDLIDVDDYRAAFDAVAHLINHGHQRIAYVGDSNVIPTSAARQRGYRDALAARDLPVIEELVMATGTTSTRAGEATHTLLDKTEPSTRPTAIFSATTRASLGVIPVLHSRDRTDLAVVGLGDFAMADALDPAVTVIDHSGARLGTGAARRLLDRIADPSLPAAHQRLATPLITRGSGELRP